MWIALHNAWYFSKDNNGRFYNDVGEAGIDYLWQADYAHVHFTFIPPDKQPLADKQVYITGELTNYGQDENAKMTFNTEKGVYETELLLKQGYYDYCYVTTDAANLRRPSFELTEGNQWETENDYAILVYYSAHRWPDRRIDWHRPGQFHHRQKWRQLTITGTKYGILSTPCCAVIKINKNNRSASKPATGTVSQR